jgi:putative membrane protein
MVMNKQSQDITLAEQTARERSLRDYVILGLKGFCMGASDVVPGVSGGTMAFILGIYEELIDAIKSIDLKVIRLALSLKVKAVLRAVPWQFLLSIFIGILLAFLTLARGLEWLLENQPLYLWSFFFGLVLASGLTVSSRVTKWGIGAVTSLVVAAIAAWFIVGLIPVQTSDTPVTIFLSGMVAICAMILPGISGAFILFVLGKYQTMLNALTNFNVATIGIFAAGAGVGIISFARVVSWLFKRYHDITVAGLIGLMLGSLRKLWPWKETISTTLDRHGETIPLVQINIAPPGFGPEFFAAVGLAVLGFVLVIALDKIAGQKGFE